MPEVVLALRHAVTCDRSCGSSSATRLPDSCPPTPDSDRAARFTATPPALAPHRLDRDAEAGRVGQAVLAAAVMGGHDAAAEASLQFG
jgi:hypothetical protein